MISQDVINLLDLKLENNTPILIGKSNIEHIKNRHPYEYDKYFSDIQNILNNPDYIGMRPREESIMFVKEYEVDSEYIRVAIKVTANKKRNTD